MSKSFEACDFGDDAGKVKHLAIYQTREDSRKYFQDPFRDELYHIVLFFCNLDTLTLVNRRHVATKLTSPLVFMEPVDLMIWKAYIQCNTIDWDPLEYDSSVDQWLEMDYSPFPDDWDKFEQLWQQWDRYRTLPWKVPKINRKIITTTYMKESLEMIAGGPGRVEKLSALSSDWLMEMHVDPIGRINAYALNSVDFTPTQLRLYMELFFATLPEYPEDLVLKGDWMFDDEMKLFSEDPPTVEMLLRLENHPSDRLLAQVKRNQASK